MSWSSGIRHVLRTILRRSAVEAEIDAELRAHLEHEVQRQLEAGVGFHEARRQAALRFGNIDTLKEAVRDERGDRALSDLMRDLSIGLRGLRRMPGFTIAVTLSLALGIGGTTAIVSVVNAVLMRPLPYPAAGELYLTRVWWADFSAWLSPADYLRLEDVRASTADVAAYWVVAAGFTLQTPSEPEAIVGARVTPSITRVLGVRPVLGRGLSPERGAAEALIGDELWRRRFGGREDVLGRQVLIDGQPVAIVGVMPRGFGVPGQRDGELWTALQFSEPTRRGPFYLRVIARLNPSIEPERAATMLTDNVTPILRERYGIQDRWRYELRSAKEVIVGDVRRTLLLFLAAAGLVLAVAVGNVANLLLARGTARSRELAVRASLGAGRSRLVRQLLAESALYGFLGGAVGLAVAAAGVGLLRSQALAVIPRMDEVQLDLFMVACALVLGVTAGLVAGVVPALRLPWRHLNESMRASGQPAGESRSRGRSRRALVVAEVALTLTVLIAAGLLLKTLARLESVQPGFSADGVLTFRLSLSDARYADAGTLQAFLLDLEDRLRSSGAAAVAYSSSLPPDRLLLSNNYTLESSLPEMARGTAAIAEWIEVSPAYFDTLRIPLTAGRAFATADRSGSEGVAIVNEAFARRHFEGRTAVGQRLKGGDWDANAPWLTIVGVAGDVPYERGVWGGAQPTVYRPYLQTLGSRVPFVLLKTDGGTADAVSRARTVVPALDPALPLRDVATMSDRLQSSIAEPRFRSTLFSLLALVAAALAATGIYGVMAYHVSTYRRETAIRRALGAPTAVVAGRVLWSGLTLSLVGTLLGVAGGLAFARTLSRVLFGVSAFDPVVTAGASLVVLFIGGLACALPAFRATRIDAMTVLRDD